MSDERPSRPTRRAPFLPSLFAAVAVFAWIAASSIVIDAVDAAQSLGGGATGLLLGDLLNIWLLGYLALAAGLLISFWLAAPVTGDLRVSQLVVRVLIAAGIGTVVMFPVEFAIFAAHFAELTAQNQQSGFPGLVDISPGPGQLDALSSGAVAALQIAIGRLPEIALAALGSWAWQRRSTPIGET